MTVAFNAKQLEATVRKLIEDDATLAETRLCISKESETFHSFPGFERRCGNPDRAPMFTSATIAQAVDKLCPDCGWEAELEAQVDINEGFIWKSLNEVVKQVTFMNDTLERMRALRVETFEDACALSAMISEARDQSNWPSGRITSGTSFTQLQNYNVLYSDEYKAAMRRLETAVRGPFADAAQAWLGEESAASKEFMLGSLFFARSSEKAEFVFNAYSTLKIGSLNFFPTSALKHFNDAGLNCEFPSGPSGMTLEHAEAASVLCAPYSDGAYQDPLAAARAAMLL